MLTATITLDGVTVSATERDVTPFDRGVAAMMCHAAFTTVEPALYDRWRLAVACWRKAGDRARFYARNSDAAADTAAYTRIATERPWPVFEEKQ